MNSTLLTPAEVARQLAISQIQLRNLVRAGRIRYVSVGLGTKRETRRYHPADIEAFLRESARIDTPAQFAGGRKPKAVIDVSEYSALRAAQRAKRESRKPDG